jgi:hypothetical protein
MNWCKSAIVIAMAVVLTGCTNHHVNFDQFPGGGQVTPWTGGSMAVTEPWVITTQYAPVGVASFSSNGRDGVFVLIDNSTASPPNTACPIGVPFGASNATGPTTIMLGQSTNNVWVTIPASYSPVTVTALDSNGAQLRSEASNGPNATASPTGRRVRVNVSGIRSVLIDSVAAGGIYCIDDFTWQEQW